MKNILSTIWEWIKYGITMIGCGIVFVGLILFIGLGIGIILLGSVVVILGLWKILIYLI